MTYTYQRDSTPDVKAIRCPKCGSEAVFRAPFTVFGNTLPPEDALLDLAARYPGTHIEQWRGLYVLVHFPSKFPWIPPPENRLYEPEREWGVSSCSNCLYQGEHKLSWPDDAYYATDFKGEILWAWNRDYTQALKSFVESKDRNPWHYPRYVLFLLHVPKLFLLAKNRDAVSRRLKRMLEYRNAQ